MSRSVSIDTDHERRRAERHACLERADAVQFSPRRRLNCIIKDVSETGCRLVGVGVDLLHSPFLLRTEDWDRARFCEVKWRSRKMIGVAFVSLAPDR